MKFQISCIANIPSIMGICMSVKITSYPLFLVRYTSSGPYSAVSMSILNDLRKCGFNFKLMGRSTTLIWNEVEENLPIPYIDTFTFHKSTPIKKVCREGIEDARSIKETWSLFWPGSFCYHISNSVIKLAIALFKPGNMGFSGLTYVAIFC